MRRVFRNLFIAAAVLAGTLGLISASAFIFLQAFAYADSRGVSASAVSSAVSVSEASGAAGSGLSSAGPFRGESRPEEPAGSSAVLSADVRTLILVNSEHRIPENYEPDLVTVDGVQMDAEAARAYAAMRDAAKADGISLWVSSGYRSVERQETLFRQEIEAYEKTADTRQEAEAFAEKSVARPGYSEHCTGLAVDLNGVLDSFDGTDAFRWLDAHAQEYGFILRYPQDKQEITKIKYEPWHYRYVGAEYARMMKEENLCLEEYLSSRDSAAETAPGN